MDIDDFLDKEIEGGTSIKSKPSKGKATQDLHEKHPAVTASDSDVSTMMSALKAEWDTIAATQLVWDQRAEDSLSKLLTQLSSKMAYLRQDLVNKRNNMQQCMNAAGSALRVGRYEDALARYEQAKRLFDSIPDFFNDEKKKLNTHLLSLYLLIQKHIDAKEQVQDFTDLVDQVKSRLSEARSFISQKNLVSAKKSYLEAIRMYKLLPAEKLLDTISLGQRLVALYKELSIRTQISQLNQQLGSPLQSQVPRAEAVPSSQQHRNHHAPHIIHGVVTKKLQRVQQFIKKGYFVDARKEINAILKLHPGNKEAHRLLKLLPK